MFCNFNRCCCNQCPPCPPFPPTPQPIIRPCNCALNTLLTSNVASQTVAAGAAIDLGTTVNVTGSAALLSSATTITLSQTGTYIIYFSALANNTATSGAVGAALNVNGVAVPTASVSLAASATPTPITLMHSLTITSPTTISFTNNSTVSNDYSNVYVFVEKVA